MDRREFFNRLGAGGLALLEGNLFAWNASPGSVSEATGPVGFGRKEFYRAMQEKGLNLPVEMAVIPGPPESFSIEPGGEPKIVGADVRGLMYGLLEAAEQLRMHGRLLPKRGSPRVRMRGIRYFVHNKDLDASWYYSRDFWDEHFAMLARDRFNRFNLVFAHQTNYLAPPYPFWVELPGFPAIRVPGLEPAERDRNLDALRYISQSAADHGIDFTLGIWEQNAWPTMTHMVAGITPENIGPYVYAALKKVLETCPGIRSVQIRTNVESGIPADQQLRFYGDYFYPALRDCGRLVTLDLRAWALKGGMLKAVESAGVPLRVSAKYWAEYLGRPYQPAETFAGYSYLDLLERPMPYEFFWELWGLGSNRLLLWGNPNYVRRVVSTFGLGGGIGFEIDPPLAQKGFGNRPGRWDIFTDSQEPGRRFWRWEPERYWLFYMLWGRLSYDPATTESVWLDELERRFGAAARDALEAYRQSSEIINEIVATHLADPNMYIWPEINPGGLVDDYIYIPPSDWRYVASIPEAVENRIRGVASAKQTPDETSVELDEIASRVESAVASARQKVKPGNKEWESSEPDFRVLALMARYHARKMAASYELEYFYQTAEPEALRAAKQDLERALGVWQELVHLTDGLYPEQMAYGPDDVGDWKDKLPYVQYDLKLISERENIFKQFGRFDFGFDFGAPAPARHPSYRNDPYVLGNNVEPRFLPVSPETLCSDGSGYGWIGDEPRRAVGIPLSPYAEVRSVAKDPHDLPYDVLFRDYIQGEGAQRFQVKTGPGAYNVVFLHPDRSTAARKLSSDGEFLTIQFPDAAWSVSGLVITRRGARAPSAPVRAREASPSRPEISHTPPPVAHAGKLLQLTLQIAPLANVSAVRLYYRPVNQLAKFKMTETDPARLAFTIPEEDISLKWDLMYYFEVLNKQGGGWFEPDPKIRTPYYVVRTQAAR